MTASEYQDPDMVEYPCHVAVMHYRQQASLDPTTRLNGRGCYFVLMGTIIAG